jgi:hypothetical protein
VATVSIWTSAQIDQVRGLRARSDVDALAPEQEAIREAAAHKMRLAIVQMAEPLAVDVHPEDIQITERESERPFCTGLTAHWAPTTEAIEFSGGPHDGERLAYENAPAPLRAPLLAPVSPLKTTLEPLLPVSLHQVYEATGWHERQRVWVYTPAD